MRFLLLCIFLVVASSVSLRAHNQRKKPSRQPYEIKGRLFGKSVNGEGDLHGPEKKIVQFIHKKIPQITEYKLQFIQKQIGRGMNYCFDYVKKDQSELKICVLSKIWENNFLRLTTSDGRVFTSGGLQTNYKPRHQPV